jgi:hypothetical protein
MLQMLGIPADHELQADRTQLLSERDLEQNREIPDLALVKISSPT